MIATLIGVAAGCGVEPLVEEDGPARWVEDLPEPVERDLDEIVRGDTLRALLVFNSTSYFIYRGEAMGYEFRALRAFAEAHDLVLEPTVVRDRTRLFELLNRGEGDVVAARLIPVPAFHGSVSLTRPLYSTRPAVVQKGAPLDSAPIPEEVEEEIDSTVAGPADPPEGPLVLRARLVRRPDQLGGDTIHIPRGSEYYGRLVELNDSIDGTIEIVELDTVLTDETVIRRVAAGELRFAVTPENVAELSDEYFTNIRVEPSLGPAHPVVWGVRRNAPVLEDSLDAWIERERHGKLDELYYTYFVDREGYRERSASRYLTSETGRLSRFDSLIADFADEIGWDWRLLASQVFQESRFDPRARSWAGAQGLLQLMPATAREMGVEDPYDPEDNLRGGVRYLEWLDDRWDDRIPDPEARLPFVLASYNAGFGHVEDAQRIAEKHGDDPKSWADVSHWLLQLSKRRHYRDPVVRFGYVRGLEPVTYVSLIRERFSHYLELVSPEPLPGGAEGDRVGRLDGSARRGLGASTGAAGSGAPGPAAGGAGTSRLGG